MPLKVIIYVHKRLVSGFGWRVGPQEESVALERNRWAPSANTDKRVVGECHRHLGELKERHYLEERASKELGTEAKSSNPGDTADGHMMARE